MPAPRRIALTICIMSAALLAATACTPPAALAPGSGSGGGSFSYALSDSTGQLDAGGGPVQWALTATAQDLLPIGCQATPTARWSGSMTTSTGFVGQSGRWKVDIRYSRGLIGDVCSPINVRLIDPDGDTRLDTATTGATDVTSTAVDDGEAVVLSIGAPLVDQPTVMASVRLEIDIPTVAATLAPLPFPF